MELSLHPNAKFIYTDAGGNSKKQIAQVKELISKGIDLLIISPNEAQPLTGIVEETYNKGIPVIILDRKTSSNLFTSFVGADNYQIGKRAGEYMGFLLKGKGNVLEILGLPGSSPAIERDQGFNDGLKKFKDIKIVNQVYGNWLKETPKVQLFRMLGSPTHINAVFAHNDDMASGAREVFHQFKLDKNVIFLGVDAVPGEGGGLQMVANHTLTASLLYPTGGKEAISTAFRILNKESFTKENILQTSIIDSSNVQLMNMQWNRISGQQKDIERQQSLLKEQEVIYNNQQVVLNIIVITLVVAIFFGGLAFHSLMDNRKINKNLEAKNNEILTQRNKLIEISDKAKMATEAKFNFFTNISHEFRTPLTLILSPLEDLLKSANFKAGEYKNLKLINKNVYRLLKLVNQLIDYRKIEYEKLQIQASSHNIVAFLQEIVENFQHIARKKNIDLRLIATENNIQVWFDANMFDKVIFNLLSNALKFTNDHGIIHVVLLRMPDGMLSIEVRDNGIGMTEDEALHVFDQFYQAEITSAKGSGLGLSLSKELINLHHGSYEVKSKKWKGTTFIIKLPLGCGHLSEAEKLSDQKNSELSYSQAQIFAAELENIYDIKPVNGLKPLKDLSVLIVEDNEDLLNYLCDKFEDHYEVFVANNGLSGINEAYEKVPDLIISDIVMPEVSGIQLTNKLKTDVRTSHIPIILLTAKGSIDQQISGMDSMADAYIVKPFYFEYLLATVKNLIKNRVILKEHYKSDVSPSAKLYIAKTLDKKFVNDFTGIVEQNLANENFNIDDICKSIGVSRIQLYRKVKALMGCNINDYILNRRLKKAKYMLLNEDNTISEITNMVGFSSHAYFSTVFKTKYGCTPSEFKRNSMR